MEKIISDIIQTYNQITFAILFGSYSRGKANDNSDIDIAYFARPSLSFEKQMELRRQLSLTLEKEIDLVDLASTRGTLLKQILTTGKIIILKNPIDRAYLIKTMLYDQEDFMPYVKRIQNARKKRLFNG